MNDFGVNNFRDHRKEVEEFVKMKEILNKDKNRVSGDCLLEVR
jgi:hypothetical protein